jgi:hypothetical protein
VRIKTAAGAPAGEMEPTQGWHFSVVTGQFVVNYNGVSTDEETQYDEY